MGVPRRDPGPMKADDFFAFTDTRPDDEKWELIDGEPVLNASPSYGHQKIVKNLVSLLSRLEEDQASWEVLPGLGIRLSGTSAPMPDVLIRPRGVLQGNLCDDVIVAFEVLSPSTADRDLRWKRRAYAETPSLMHYVVVAQDAIELVAFDRNAGWQERRVKEPAATLHLETLDVTLAIADLYRGTALVAP